MLNKINIGQEAQEYVAKIADFGLTAEVDTNVFADGDKIG